MHGWYEETRNGVCRLGLGVVALSVTMGLVSAETQPPIPVNARLNGPRTARRWRVRYARRRDGLGISGARSFSPSSPTAPGDLYVRPSIPRVAPPRSSWGGCPSTRARRVTAEAEGSLTPPRAAASYSSAAPSSGRCRTKTAPTSRPRSSTRPCTPWDWARILRLRPRSPPGSWTPAVTDWASREPVGPSAYSARSASGG